MTVVRPNEAQIQAAILMAMSRLFNCRTVHVPNGGQRNKREAMTLKSMGVWAGHPDLIIYGEDERDFLMEVKDGILACERDVPAHERIQTLDPKQKTAVAELRARGKRVYVVASVDEAISAGQHFGLSPKLRIAS